MKISIIGDTHLSHKNIASYCDRPDDWEELIEENLCNLETFPPDLLIHLGDVSLGNDEQWHDLITNQLPCKKWLVLGNHDNKSMTWYLNHGWDFVARSFTMYYFGLRIFFSHRPSIIPPTKLFVKEKVRDVEITKERSNFDINIHGHIHNSNINLPDWCKPYIIEDRDYKPIDLKGFLDEEIKAKQKSLQEK